MTANRDLLFGLLALQVGMIDQGQLVAAFQAWTLEKSRSLAEILVGRGDLSSGQRDLLEALADQHMQKHGNAEKSLAVVSAGRSTRDSLARLGDPDIDATLGHVPSSHGSTEDGDADRTASFAVGTSTSDGQRFRVLRPHAQGGLGAVFVALDSELNREVALKQIVDHHADDPTSRQRFLLEAEVTGGLEHPGIVPVYGLGSYADGRPYYAMRFIRGDSLKEAIDRFHAGENLRTDAGKRSLELRKLLRRFTDVCNAIDYAHSRGVLHRDIKPGNIIVGKHGETLVVDWGLAKPMGHVDPGNDAGERTLMPCSASGSAETLPGSALGTPAYMSPEQAEGDLERLGPRSDVYSLGATLYCLLTGKSPFEGGDIGPILRKVQRGEFPPPRHHDPSLDKGLEAICLKAMAVKPEDRYASCRVLAEDVERWMADEPVAAWREPWTRTLLRWLSRHRTGLTGAAAAALAGVVGLSAVLVVQARANTQLSASLDRETAANRALGAANEDLTRSKAAVQSRYDLAVDAVKTFHTGASEDFLLKEVQFKNLRDGLLKSASDFYGKLSALLGTETDFASRRALAQSNFEVAELTGKVGRNEDALAAHRAVLVARQAMAAEPRTEPRVKVEVGQSLTAVAGVLASTGKTDEALAAFREAEALLADLAPSASASGALAALANCRARRGYLLYRAGKNDEALAAYRLARSDQAALAASPEARNESQRDLSNTINRIGVLLERIGKPVEAEAEYREAMAIQQKLADANPAFTDIRVELAVSHNNLGYLLALTGKPSEAESHYRDALAVNQKLAVDNPAVAMFRSRLAAIHTNLGILLAETGKLTEAEPEFRKAVAIQRKLADDNPTVTEFCTDEAIGRSCLGNLMSQMGKLSEAEAETRKAIAIEQKLADDNPADTEFRNMLAFNHINLGILLSKKGKPSEAESEYRKATAIEQKLVDDNPTVTDFRNQLARGHSKFGILLLQTGRPSEAEAQVRKAIAIQQKLGDDNPAVTEFRNAIANNRINLGILLSQTGKLTDAETEYLKAMAIQQKLVEDNPKVPDYRDDVASALNHLGDLRRRRGHQAAARDGYERAIAIGEALIKENPMLPMYRSHLGYSLRRLGLTRLGLGDAVGAAADARRALGFWDSLPSRSGEEWFETACCYAALAGLAGRDGTGVPAASADTAIDLLRRAVEMGYLSRDTYRTETALDPIRGRPEFQLLMMDLAFPAQPYAPAR